MTELQNPELPPLPELDTRSFAYSGRSVDYINGYEAGYESAAEQMRSYGELCARLAREAERERAAKVAEGFATCGCGGAHGRCMEDDAPLAIASAIRKTEGK